MSKQDELQYEQQEKRIQAQSDAFITLLTKRGILGDSQIDDAQKRAARQEKTKNCYHNTLMLLQHYRTLVWMLECFPETVAAELDRPFEGVDGNQQSCGCKKREHESELGTYLTHIDGTSIEALKSSKIPSNNTTGVRGVYCVKGRYKAKIVFQKKQFSLGTYDTLAEAATARKKAEKMLKSEVIAFYERWTAKAAANPAWAKENPIHFQVTKNGAEELELQLAPKLDPETH